MSNIISSVKRDLTVKIKKVFYTRMSELILPILNNLNSYFVRTLHTQLKLFIHTMEIIYYNLQVALFNENVFNFNDDGKFYYYGITSIQPELIKVFLKCYSRISTIFLQPCRNIFQETSSHF